MTKTNKPLSDQIIVFSRFSLFVVYFWFGALKVFGLSPAEDLVKALFDLTISPFIAFNTFFVIFGLFECLVGILFISKGFERYAFIVMLVHIFTTAMPLFVLPKYTWNGYLVLTQDGQYIMKNLLIVALGWVLYHHHSPK